MSERGNAMNSSSMTSIEGPARDPWNNPLDRQRNDANNRQQNAGNDQQRPNDSNSPDNKKNNGGVDDDAIDNIWNDIKDENSKPNGGNQQQQQPQNNQQQQQQPDAETQRKNYLAGVGLAPIVLSDEQKEQLKNGEFDDFVKNINQKLVSAHIEAVKSSNTLIEAKVADAVEKAVGKSKEYMAGQKSLDALHEALPWTKDPAIGPVVQTVMQRFLDRGASTTEAIKGADMWSKKFMKAANPDFVEPNGNRNGNFRNAQEKGSGEPLNFLDILSPKS